MNKQQNTTNPLVLRKKWKIALVLSICCGLTGADRFYLGNVGLGIFKLFTLGGFMVFYFIDIILIATKNIRGVEWVD